MKMSELDHSDRHVDKGFLFLSLISLISFLSEVSYLMMHLVLNFN